MPGPIRESPGDTEVILDLSVVIPAHNAEGTIGETLEGLARQELDAQWEVVVADNASTDRTAEIARSFSERIPCLRIVEAPRLGVSSARNQGARDSRGRSLVWLDADDVPAPGWLEAVATALERHELIGSSHDNDTLNSESAGGRSAQATLEPMRLWYPPHVAHVGACGMGVRKSLWAQLGGFDEGLPVLEDTDFCIRAQNAGVGVHLADAWIQVRFRRSLRQTFRQARLWSATNVLLFSRYRPQGARLPEAWRNYTRGWFGVVRLLGRARSQKHRSRLAWRLGWQLGMLQGCIRHRVPPIPYPSLSETRPLSATTPEPTS